MSKNLTPPTWYDNAGNEINIFDNTTYSKNGPDNIAIGTNAVAGYSKNIAVSSALAIGYQAKATANSATAIGSCDEAGSSGETQAFGIGSIAIGAGAKTDQDSNNGIAIGRGAMSTQGGIAIGAGADAIGDDMIQLGNNNQSYTLKIGNGAVKIYKSGSIEAASSISSDSTITAKSGFSSNTYTVTGMSSQSLTSSSGSKKLKQNYLYLIKLDFSFIALLHTVVENATVHQFLYGASSTEDWVMSVSNSKSSSDTICQLQKYNRGTLNYRNITDTEFTAIPVCSFTNY